MPARYQICCVTRSDHLNHDRRIRLVGGVNPDGSRWKITAETAAQGIETGRWSLFLSQNGRDFDIVVATSRYGNKYIKSTEDRGLNPDSLLALPNCR